MGGTILKQVILDYQRKTSLFNKGSQASEGEQDTKFYVTPLPFLQFLLLVLPWLPQRYGKLKQKQTNRYTTIKHLSSASYFN